MKYSVQIVGRCTSNVYGSKVVDSVVVRCCVYVKRVRHQVWIILNTRLTIKVLLFVWYPLVTVCTQRLKARSAIDSLTRVSGRVETDIMTADGIHRSHANDGQSFRATDPQRAQRSRSGQCRTASQRPNSWKSQVWSTTFWAKPFLNLQHKAAKMYNNKTKKKEKKRMCKIPRKRKPKQYVVKVGN